MRLFSYFRAVESEEDGQAEGGDEGECPVRDQDPDAFSQYLGGFDEGDDAPATPPPSPTPTLQRNGAGTRGIEAGSSSAQGGGGDESECPTLGHELRGSSVESDEDAQVGKELSGQELPEDMKTDRMLYMNMQFNHLLSLALEEAGGVVKSSHSSYFDAILRNSRKLAEKQRLLMVSRWGEDWVLEIERVAMEAFDRRFTIRQKSSADPSRLPNPLPGNNNGGAISRGDRASSRTPPPVQRPNGGGGDTDKDNDQMEEVNGGGGDTNNVRRPNGGGGDTDKDKDDGVPATPPRPPPPPHRPPQSPPKRNGKKKRDRDDESEDSDSESECSADSLHVLLLEEQERAEIVGQMVADGSACVVAKFRLFEVVTYQMALGVDPRRPDYRSIGQIANSVTTLILNLEVYKKWVATFARAQAQEALANAEQTLAEVIELDVSTSTRGTILRRIEQIQTSATVRGGGIEGQSVAIPEAINSSLSNLKVAMHRCDTGREPPVKFDSRMTVDDIPKMKKIAKVEQPLQNLLVNILCIPVGIGVDSELSVGGLFSGLTQELARARALAEMVDVSFDPEMSVLDYKTDVIFSALEMAREGGNTELEQAVLTVAGDIAAMKSDTRKGLRKGDRSRKDMVLAACKKYESMTPDGRPCDGDGDAYFSGSSDLCSDRRRRLFCLDYIHGMQEPIMSRLPDNLFPDSFIPTMLVHAPTYIERHLNFKNMPGFFDESFHDEESQIYTDLQKKLRQVKKDAKALIIDSQAQVDSLRQLVEI